jgi:RNA polymerase sigma-70 factor (ECF subfamily)
VEEGNDMTGPGPDDALASAFEQQRGRLVAVAHRMLGSRADAEDAVQEAWLRLARQDAAAVGNLAGWLTTVVGRICIDMLRSRTARPEVSYGDGLPEFVVTEDRSGAPEEDSLLAESVGLALLVVLDTLAPAERLAFVLHDMFAVPFDEIAPMIDRSPTAARQLASRARRRVQGRAPAPDPDLARQRIVVDAFFAAARKGDFDALVAVLDPDVVLRADGGAARGRPTFEVHGAQAVAQQSVTGERWARLVRPALVNGAAGVVVAAGDTVLSVMGFTVAHDRIVAIDVLWDPKRLVGLDLTVLD